MFILRIINWETRRVIESHKVTSIPVEHDILVLAGQKEYRVLPGRRWHFGSEHVGAEVFVVPFNSALHQTDSERKG